jgi:hypothetical protein
MQNDLASFQNILHVARNSLLYIRSYDLLSFYLSTSLLVMLVSTCVGALKFSSAGRMSFVKRALVFTPLLASSYVGAVEF